MKKNLTAEETKKALEAVDYLLKGSSRDLEEAGRNRLEAERAKLGICHITQ